MPHRDLLERVAAINNASAANLNATPAGNLLNAAVAVVREYRNMRQVRDDVSLPTVDELERAVREFTRG